uniref:Uncharacterized protein n=1 Tax=Arundo donax TaxID=35708 RepID=A0A0A9GXI9_ARUDO
MLNDYMSTCPLTEMHITGGKNRFNRCLLQKTTLQVNKNSGNTKQYKTVDRTLRSLSWQKQTTRRAVIEERDCKYYQYGTVESFLQ